MPRTDELTRLAREINAALSIGAEAEEEEVVRAGEKRLQFWQAGVALNKAKECCIREGKGWGKWLGRHCPNVHERMARRYMELASRISDAASESGQAQLEKAWRRICGHDPCPLPKEGCNEEPAYEALEEDHEGPVSEPARTGCAVAELHQLVASGQRFGTIYADPPWAYANKATRAAAADHYPTMAVEEIAALPVAALAADCCHLHLWTTNAFLFECPRLFDAWGFTYQGVFVWCKPQIGIGNCWRVSHEFLLLAIKGEPRSFLANNLRSWGEYDRSRHSAKPEQVRLAIERASPGPYVELFARNAVPGWTCWGNEVARDDLFNHQLPDASSSARESDPAHEPILLE